MATQIVDILLTGQWWYFTLGAPYASCPIVFDHSSSKVKLSKFLSLREKFSLYRNGNINLFESTVRSPEKSFNFSFFFITVETFNGQLHHNIFFRKNWSVHTESPNVMTSDQSKIIVFIFSRFVFAWPSHCQREFRRKSIIFSST